MLSEKELQRLHKAGIEKTVNHVFVYRYPDSDDMPLMDLDEFLTDAEKSSKKERELALYAHVPFCTSICSYCHYFKQPLGDGKQIAEFMQSVEKEIISFRKLIEAKVEVNSILFGGGTPTALKAEQLNQLMLFLQSAFPTQKKIEATVESSPETLDLEKLSALRQNFNRLSMGVQDFNDAVLHECNRNHSRKQALKAISEARNAGFGNINVDLIYGLPLQGIASWKKTLGEVEAIQPESVTASELRIQKGTAFFARNKKEFASEKELVEMHTLFIEKMLSLGYRQLFPYQFAKQGKEMRFLQNQWSNREFVGFGPSSCSYFNAWDYNNVFPLQEYIGEINDSGFACAVGKKLSREEQMIRHAALGLKNIAGIDKKEFRKEFGESIEAQFGKQIELLESLGLVENSESTLKLSEKGILFYDSVSRKFFPSAKNSQVPA